MLLKNSKRWAPGSVSGLMNNLLLRRCVDEILAPTGQSVGGAVDVFHTTLVLRGGAIIEPVRSQKGLELSIQDAHWRVHNPTCSDPEHTYSTSGL